MTATGFERSNNVRADSTPRHAQKSLVEYVDDLERGLATCLMEYRTRAEGVLAAHLEAIQSAENSFKLESAKLIAENKQLRDMLTAMGATCIPSLPQTQSVMMVADTGKPRAPQTSHAKGQRSRKAATDDDDDEDKHILHSRRKVNGKEPNANGSWQQFVAWVPYGAALGNPEPWKPLPTPLLDAPLEPCVGASRSNVSKKSYHHTTTSNALMNILPGTPSHPGDQPGRGGENESEGSEKSSAEDRDTFELLETWVATDREKKKLGKNVGNVDGESAFSGLQSVESERNFRNDGQVPRFFIMSPDSRTRVTWDLSSLAMVIYDMILIPLIVFQLPESLFLATMEWCTRVFWTFDIVWSCCTGITMPDGSIEYRPAFILKRYAKTWLGLDLFIVGSDWMGLLFSSGGIGFSRLARVSRIVRVVRLLRMVRMQEVISNITERIQSDKICLVVQALKLLIFLVSVSHMTACGWWGLGITSGDTWASLAHYDSQSIDLQYLVSLHWAMAQFTGGMDEIVANTAYERLFAVTMWVFGFMSAAVISSILTSSLTQQYIIGGAGARKMSTLRKYLNQNRVPSNLAMRVCRSAKHAISGDLTPESVELLSVVSEPLKVEMHQSMYGQILAAHPFFQDYFVEGPQVMRRVCHMAMSMMQLAYRDVVFTRGEMPPEPKMYFCVSGVLEYTDSYQEMELVTEKMWVAEAAIWTTWKHQGNLVATNDVKLAVLDAQVFGDICRRWMKKMKSTFNPKLYACQFVESLNKQERLTDLHFI